MSDESSNSSSDVGVVAIGRNEGERLRRCLASAVAPGRPLVYVDSGSSDGSVEAARELGATVVQLDLSQPFTAARARNAGYRRLLQDYPQVRFVQFVDGDCEFAAGWIDRARQEFDGEPKLAAVCGRRRERHPERSVYNRLCDVEWDTPVGLADACGGDAMFRAEALTQAEGYDARLIAGEEPELCARLRKGGWTIRRIGHEMTLHDAAMYRWRQWVRRAVRSGYGEAELAALHGRSEPGFARPVRSAWIWAGLVPAIAIVLAWPTRGLSLLLLALYPIQVARIYRRTRPRLGGQLAMAYATTCVTDKFPRLSGVIKYHVLRLTGRRGRIIEYKGAATTAAPAAAMSPAAR
jgi:glycosyltransferase involved in cell wall biosynthesis